MIQGSEWINQHWISVDHVIFFTGKKFFNLCFFLLFDSVFFVLLSFDAQQHKQWSSCCCPFTLVVVVVVVAAAAAAAAVLWQWENHVIFEAALALLKQWENHVIFQPCSHCRWNSEQLFFSSESSCLSAVRESRDFLTVNLNPTEGKHVSFMCATTTTQSINQTDKPPP